MHSRSLRVLLVASLFAAFLGAFAGPMTANGYFALTEIQLTNDSYPQNRSDIDGDYVVWRDGRNGTCGAWDIYGYKISTGEEFEVTTEEKKQENPRISDGVVVYQSDQDCDGWPNNTNIYVYDIEADEHTVIADREADQEVPDISGDVVVWAEYDYDDKADWDIYAYDRSTDTETQVTDDTGWQYNPRVDGDIVVWEDERNGDSDIYAYDLSTDTEFEVCTADDYQWDPVVEGDTIAWIDDRNDDGSTSIYIYSIAGGTEEEVYTSDSDIDGLAIDQGRLIWSDETTGDGDLYMYDLASGATVRLTMDPYCDGRPAISGAWVSFNRYMPAAGYPDMFIMPLEEIATEYVTAAGSDRYGTSVEVSQRTFPNGAETVIVATGANWPDALGASALAGVYDAPILLTRPDALPADVLAEIERLEAVDAFVIGGPAAVSEDVEDELVAALTGSVTRLGGLDRYETANLVAEEVVAAHMEWDGVAFVTTGLNFPDALAASPLAAKAGWPIFLSHADGVSAATKTAMDDLGVTKMLVLGGTGVVPAEIVAQGSEVGILEVERIGGMNRYATAVAVAQFGANLLGLSWNGVAVATGENFPDALSAGAAQGQINQLMLLTPTAYLDSAPAAAIAANKFAIGHVKFIGGLSAISSVTRAQVAEILP
ncbi:MAG: cell wall-binding repeat-containing protein [Coriobacteriia bacterium]|nr:cell wall-binding repeat-containing protein [Coriobacteriia bacterium]